MAYAHARPGERCSRCNDYASRVVAMQPLCVDHFAAIIERCRHAVRRRILTPTDMTPDGFIAWAETLRNGIADGHITDDEAARAWNTAKDFAA